MKRKRILFDVIGTQEWIGGIYYIRNIVYQICISEKILSVCKPVIICDEKYLNIFGEFSGKADVLFYKKRNKIQRYCKLIPELFLTNYIYNYHKYKFDIFDLLEKKAIFWIPDFQECYYSKFFTQKELERRWNYNKKIADIGNSVVLSSKSAKNDFYKFFKAKKNIYVVPFVSAIEKDIMDLKDDFCLKVISKYGLTGSKYILVSNQFWQHKNHIVVFQAIAEAKNKGLFNDIIFVFTGELKDYRNRKYYLKLKSVINETNIEDRIKILGFIERKDQLALMHKAQLIIQPSLFEGWGTVVEDAKVLDKTIVLSDIPVHREQKNNKCFLFDANVPKSLIEVLKIALDGLEDDNVENGIAQMKVDAEKYSQNLLKLICDMEKRKC